jgi:DNA (cytosine-5)-methyltransferase 1
MARVVREVLPAYVFAENVTRAAIEQAAFDCADMGFKTEMLSLSAADLGADHVRARHWLLAHADDKGELRRHIDAKVAECPEFHEGVWQAVPWRTGMADGVAGRMDRYEATGNGQVSIVAAAALWALAHADC